MAQGERDARSQEGRDREEAHQQAQKLTAQRERTRQKAERKRIKTREAEEKKTKGGKGASGWVLVPMRDDHGQVLYHQSEILSCEIPPSRWPSGQANEEEEKAATCASEFPTISDYANGNQYSSDQGVNKNENYPPASTGLYTWG
jgi:hypothetical protein